jgi:molybdopterin molybdotransferase
MRVVSVDEAAREIIAAVPRQPALRMPLLDALGHLLAEDVVAPISLPPWTNAGMDGYAVRSDDIRNATADSPIRLRLVASIAAGSNAHRAIASGEAARIFTGAPVPAGADSVVRQEDTERDGDVVVVLRSRDAVSNIRQAGSDIARGALALARGTTIGPRQVALLAALAVSHPVAHRRPRVGILTSGDELVSLERPDDILDGTHLADANTPALTALIIAAGGIPVPLGIARDDAAAIEAMVRSADDIDMLITAGGVSVGEHDHVRTVMRGCDVHSRFDRVRLRPGGPTTFGTFPDGRPWLALPGNPVSAVVTFELFGRIAIRAMAGHDVPLRRKAPARLAAGVKPDLTLDQYLRCTLEWSGDDAVPVATLTGPQGSGILTSVARADALVIVPSGQDPVAAGTIVSSLTLD